MNEEVQGQFSEPLSANGSTATVQQLPASGAPVAVPGQTVVQGNWIRFLPSAPLVLGTHYRATFAPVDSTGESGPEQVLEFTAANPTVTDVQATTPTGTAGVRVTFVRGDVPADQLSVTRQHHAAPSAGGSSNTPVPSTPVTVSAGALAAGEFTETGVAPGEYDYVISTGAANDPLRSGRGSGSVVVADPAIPAPTVQGVDADGRATSMTGAYSLQGTAPAGSTVTVHRWNDSGPLAQQPVLADANGYFAFPLALQNGENPFVVRSWAAGTPGAATTVTITFGNQQQPPNPGPLQTSGWWPTGQGQEMHLRSNGDVSGWFNQELGAGSTVTLHQDHDVAGAPVDVPVTGQVVVDHHEIRFVPGADLTPGAHYVATFTAFDLAGASITADLPFVASAPAVGRVVAESPAGAAPGAVELAVDLDGVAAEQLSVTRWHREVHPAGSANDPGWIDVDGVSYAATELTVPTADLATGHVTDTLPGPGEYYYEVRATSPQGDSGTSVSGRVVLADPQGAAAQVQDVDLSGHATSTTAAYSLQGTAAAPTGATAAAGSTVTVRRGDDSGPLAGQPVPVDADGHFTLPVDLQPGDNRFVVRVWDAAGTPGAATTVTVTRTP